MLKLIAYLALVSTFLVAVSCQDAAETTENGDEKTKHKCHGKNEFFTCGGACDNVCATLDTQNRTWCPIINIKCNEMCYCVDGTARDDNDKCVPIAYCKKPPSSKSKT